MLTTKNRNIEEYSGEKWADEALKKAPAAPERGTIPFEVRGKPVGAAVTEGQRQIIYLALGADIETGYHEGYHILRTRLNDNDKKILDKYFKGNEEAEASLFAEYAKTNKAPTTIIRTVFNKIKRILNKIRSALAGRGFRTVEDIFGEIKEGRVRKTEGGELMTEGKTQYETSNEKARRQVEHNARIKARKARLKAQRETAKPKARRTRLKIRLQDTTPPLRGDLAPQEPPGPAPGLTEQPPPGKAKTPTRVILDEKFYKDNARKLKNALRNTLSEKTQRIMLEINRGIQAMSSRLERIAPELKTAVRRYVFDAGVRTVQMTEDCKDFIKQFRKFQNKDKRAFKFAVMNSQHEKISEINDKYEAGESYEKVRAVLDDIHQAGNQVGLDILYKADYWPRMVKNFDGLIEYLQTTENWAPIQQALFKRQEQAGGRELTDEEKAQVINTLLRGYRIGGISLSRPGPARERTIELFDKNIEPFYYELDEALNMYIQQMAHAIGAREFFGKQTREISKLKAQRSRLKTSLYKLTTRIGYKRPWSQEKYDLHISKRKELLEQVELELQKRKTQTFEDSVGWLVKDLVLSDRIQPQQQRELSQILRAIFDPKGMGSTVRLFTKLAYVDVLAQPTVALTQLEEMGLAFYQDKFRSLPAAIRASIGKSELKLADIGVEDINQYMMDLGFSTLGDNLMFMMRATDKAGKEAFINTTLNKYRAQAKRATTNASFLSKMRKIFGPDYKEVIEDLKNDRVTDNVKFLAFNELSDVQPISIAETPEFYARGGNWRIVYMLRNFTLRRLDLLRNKARKMMVNPAKNPAQFVRGFADFMQLLAIMTVFGVGKDMIRAWFLGREFDDEDLQNSVIDNLLQYVMLSRYVAYRARKEGPGSAIAQEVFPPTKTPDALIHDIRKGKIDRLVRSVPEVGENWYWWFGGGRAKIEDDEESTWP